MKLKRIDETNRYRFESLEGESGSREFITNEEVRTFFLHKGLLFVDMYSKRGSEKYTLFAGEGFIAGPGAEYRLSANRAFFAVQSSSQVKLLDPIIEIINKSDKKEEAPLYGHKFLKDIKKVKKPWGHELWISWLRDYHVLKQIRMEKGNMSSLQLHKDKLETNYLVEGEADVIDGYPVDLRLSEDEMKNLIREVDWARYTERKKPGMFWTSAPGIVHRVISVIDYIAYETSTPELDDVIRLSDQTGRISGRIDSEHL